MLYAVTELVLSLISTKVALAYILLINQLDAFKLLRMCTSKINKMCLLNYLHNSINFIELCK